MGDQKINQLTGQGKKEFLKYLLHDIEAMQHMVDKGMIEKGVTRIGAEQEFCLVGPGLRPSMSGPAILRDIDESHFTSELAKWNLEINLDPQEFTGQCFTRMHEQLDTLLALARKKAGAHGDKVILTGILPTIRKSELDFKNMTPNPRYKVLDQSMKEQKGGDFTVYIEGVDELSLKHDSILFEACNTSFQIHLQIDPDEFADRYNWAQVISGPVLAPCVNSPVLLGKELWSETRLAVFRQSIDIRNAGNYIRDQQPRVAFGDYWLNDSATEIFKKDVSLYNLIVSGDIDESSMDVLERGEIPELRALNLHNGTIYKWNRACYGIGGGVPHLRIENRYIPSGPTSMDEMAATVFWTGLMMGMPDSYRGAWSKKIQFRDVRSNFLKAARNGLSNEFNWFGKSIDAVNLVGDTLLPMAEEALHRHGIPESEYKPYLEVIHARLRNRQTGSAWMVKAMRQARENGASKDEALLIVTKSMEEQSAEGTPVHEWSIPGRSVIADIPERFDRVDSVMSTELITVREDDLLLFAEKLMDWHDYSTLPVEGAKGTVVGLVSRTEIAAHDDQSPDDDKDVVKGWMQQDIVTIGPEGSIAKARKAMEINESDCLPVVKDGQLVGLVTKSDIRALEESQ